MINLEVKYSLGFTNSSLFCSVFDWDAALNDDLSLLFRGSFELI